MFIFGQNLSHWRSTFNFFQIKNCLILFLSITEVPLIKTLNIILFFLYLPLSNNVKGLQSTKKRLKLFNFLKNKIGPKGILFLQETHSSVETKEMDG